MLPVAVKMVRSDKAMLDADLCSLLSSAIKEAEAESASLRALLPGLDLREEPALLSMSQRRRFSRREGLVVVDAAAAGDFGGGLLPPIARSAEVRSNQSSIRLRGCEEREEAMAARRHGG